MSTDAAEVTARRPLLLRQFAVVSAVLFLGFAAATALLARQQARDARNTAHDLVCHELLNLVDIWQDNQSAGLFDALHSRPEGFRYEFLDGLFHRSKGDYAKRARNPMTEARTDPDPDCASLLTARKLQDFSNDGMSDVQIETGRFEAEGQAYLLARLRVRAFAGAKREIDVGYPIASAAAGSIPLIGLTGLLALGTIFAFGRAAHRSFERRITALNRTFERFVSGERGVRAPREAVNDELSELGRNLNASLDRIQGLVDEQKRFNQQIAHDFRRPLAGILLDVGEILDTCSEGAARELLRSVRDRVGDLRNTFDRAIEPPADEFFALNLSGLIAAVVRDFMLQAQTKGLQLKSSIEPNVWTLGSRESLTSLFANLIDNAIKYTPRGMVRAELAIGERSFEVRICDTGPGLEEHLAKELLQPFKRGAHARDTAGHGLGLTFVVNSVLRHGFAMRRRNLSPGLEIAISGPILPVGDSLET